VCAAQALHPEWTVSDHVAHLRQETGRDVDPIWVARWLRNIASEENGSEVRPNTM
jgi:hypothetical protein